ncbi:hypothetical protein ACFOGI_09130 [Virgibacillus xinjiangensis]|uniref:Uncharacterized protein n=1 Tax=Virgibacillus xinjiangensis TaxID=393090 RepID=A0ABV7CW69_9BACI
MISAGGSRNQQESGDIGRRLAESAGEHGYPREVLGISRRAVISLGGSRNRQESDDIARRLTESAGER